MKHSLFAVLLLITAACFSQPLPQPKDSRGTLPGNPIGLSLIAKGIDTVKWTLHWSQMLKIRQLLVEAVQELKKSDDLVVSRANELGQFSDSLSAIIDEKYGLWFLPPKVQVDSQTLHKPPVNK